MSTRTLRFWAMFAVTALALVATSSNAHEFKLDAVMNAFVQIDASEAHLVIRAPLYVFKAAKFPIKAAEIDVEASKPAIERALTSLQQDVTLYEDGRALVPLRATGRLSLPSDRSFESYEQSVQHVATPAEPGTSIMVDQGYVDAEIVYPISSPQAVFAVQTKAAPDLGDYLKLAIRYISPGEGARAMVVTSRSGIVRLNPSWLHAASGFIGSGIAHIVTGYDHLLFLLCLLLPLRGLRQIVTVVTGFTLAHSFTLIGSAFNLAPGGAWFPPFVEMVIALSIVYMALEDIIGVEFRRRLLLTMLFGLAHGFGFSYGLREDLQFAGTHLLVSLFAFNVGVEIGQIVVLLVMLPLLTLVTRYLLPGRVGTIILAALVAHTGWHWMLERWEALRNAPWPTLDAANVATLLLWMGGLVVAGGLIGAMVVRLRLVPAREEAPTIPARSAG